MKFFTEHREHVSRHINMYICGKVDTMKVILKNRWQTYSLETKTKDIRNDQQLQVKHMYTDIHSWFQSTRLTLALLSLSTFIVAYTFPYIGHTQTVEKKKSCTHGGVERTWQTFEPRSNKNPSTFQQNIDSRRCQSRCIKMLFMENWSRPDLMYLKRGSNPMFNSINLVR